MALLLGCQNCRIERKCHLYRCT